MGAPRVGGWSGGSVVQPIDTGRVRRRILASRPHSDGGAARNASRPELSGSKLSRSELSRSSELETVQVLERRDALPKIA
jgi:hypothetical protein